jgi:hypothetical protein
LLVAGPWLNRVLQYALVRAGRQAYKQDEVRLLVRLFAAGVAWLAAIVLFAALLQWSGQAPTRLSTSRDGVTHLARSLNSARTLSAAGDYTWTVTKATSALRALVVEVDAVNPTTDAPDIARRLVTSVGARYDEVLVYVQGLDTTRNPLVHRIEWTPRRGYLASTF